MKKLILCMAFLSQLAIGMQPLAPTIQNRTIKIPARASDSAPYQRPITMQLGPVIGGVLPYTYQIVNQTSAPFGISPDGQFWIMASKLPLSFQYSVTDALGQVSPFATITLEPGANVQEETLSLSEVEPG